MSKEIKPAKGGRQQHTRNSAPPVQADLLRRALEWIVNERIFDELTLHGNTSWMTTQLVSLAVLWVWSDKGTLGGAFEEARQLSLTMFGQVAVTTYQGLTGALVTWTGQLLPLLWGRLHLLMEQIGGTHWRIGKWLPLAVDGSRVTTPRTRSNEEAFSSQTYGQSHTSKSRRRWRNKKKRSKPLSEPVKPQIWLTLIWHMGLKMPWCWQTGPSTSSERGHFRDVLQTHQFPENTLFCCDAGFQGYDLWKAILDHGQHFLIRVGGNVRLLRELGHTRQRQGLVYLWPSAVARRKQSPLLLRLLEFQAPRGKIYLVTNVLAENALTLSQARQLYRLRWGVELQFRSFKQTFGRSKLRSRTAERARVEMDWSLLGLWMIQLSAVREQIKVDQPPEQSSVALALSAIQDAMRLGKCAVTQRHALRRRLRQATKDKYQRSTTKQARYQPNYKDKPSATKPIVTLATKKQRQAYQLLANAL
jgi:hypothetical protein